MAKWSGNKVNPEQINNGNEYSVNDNLSVEALNGIVNNSINSQVNSERALKLAEGANKANGTVVEINGVPQGTWDATAVSEITTQQSNFVKNEYEKGLNKFDLTNAISNDGEAYGENGETLYWGGYCRFTNYTEVKSNTNYVLSINGDINTYTTYAFYDINKNFISQTAGNGKIIIPANARYLRFACQKLRAEINTIMLNEGNEALPYQPFYGDIVRNGEKEQQFLKNEYNKGLNLISNERIEFNTWQVWLGYVYNLKPNTNYVLTTTNNNPSNVGYNFTIKKASDDTTIQEINNNYGLGLSEMVFTTSANIVEGEKYYIYGAGTFEGLNITEATLVEGTTPMRNLPYQGELIRKVDITPVKLWENASPDSDFPEDTVNLKENYTNYKYLIIEFKPYWYAQNQTTLVSKYRITDGIDPHVTISASWCSSTEHYDVSRDIYLTNSNQMVIFEGYKDNGIDNNRCIPIRVYGSNY